LHVLGFDQLLDFFFICHEGFRRFFARESRFFASSLSKLGQISATLGNDLNSAGSIDLPILIA
jgi:hypothetical protein